MNRCEFTGHVGKSELRHLSDGRPVLNFSIAVNEKWVDKDTGEKKEHTEWIQCSIFGKRAQSLAEYVTVGKHLLVVGKWKTRKYQAKDGTDRWATECSINEVEFLGGGRGKSQDGGNGGGGPSGDAYDQQDAGGAPDEDLPF